MMDDRNEYGNVLGVLGKDDVVHIGDWKITMSQNMDEIVQLKTKANEAFKLGVRLGPQGQGRDSLIEACMMYAKAIEAVVAFESLYQISSLQDTEAMATLKPTLFLNLGMTNYKLCDFTECRRCCNAAIVLCNDTTMKLEELGVEDDINNTIRVLQPVIPLFSKLVAKILLWRARSQYNMKNIDEAVVDLREAFELQPGDKTIEAELSKVSVHMKDEGIRSNYSTSITSRQPNSTPSQAVLKPDDLMNNGGKCWSRRGIWSQSIAEATVYLPISLLQRFQSGMMNVVTGKDVVVEFSSTAIEIQIGTCSEYLRLQYPIISSDCSWYLDTIMGAQYLILVLAKAPPCGELYPGCEWWERVFDGDECIETMTCSVGSAIQDLPSHARERAAMEHQRFLGLTDSEKAVEMDDLIKKKKDFDISRLRTKAEADEEDQSLDEVPERAEMLAALRSEFSHIKFTSK